jgi:hypothetical protein
MAGMSLAVQRRLDRLEALHKPAARCLLPDLGHERAGPQAPPGRCQGLWAGEAGRCRGAGRVAAALVRTGMVDPLADALATAARLTMGCRWRPELAGG